MKYRNTLVLVGTMGAMFVSVCSSTNTLKPIECKEEDECKARAEEICKTKDYYVVWREHHGIRQDRNASETTTTSNVSGAFGSKRYFAEEPTPVWKYMVDCDRSEWTAATTIQPAPLPKQKDEAEQAKNEYIAAVCNLRDSDERRDELEIARRSYPDASCNNQTR